MLHRGTRTHPTLSPFPATTPNLARPLPLEAPRHSVSQTADWEREVAEGFARASTPQACAQRAERAKPNEVERNQSEGSARVYASACTPFESLATRRLACFFETTPLLAALRSERSASRSALVAASTSPLAMAVRAVFTTPARPVRTWRLRARFVRF